MIDLTTIPVELLKFRCGRGKILSVKKDVYDQLKVCSDLDITFYSDFKGQMFSKEMDGYDLVIDEDKYNKWLCDKEMENLLE